MWHHILPGWLVLCLYGGLVLWEGAERAAIPALCAGILLLLAGALSLSEKRRAAADDPPSGLPALLALFSGILLLADGLRTGASTSVLLGSLLTLFAGAFVLLTCVIHRK